MAGRKEDPRIPGGRSKEDHMAKGIFMDGTITGLCYETGRGMGRLDEEGCFSYEEGDSITFSAGGVLLGSTLAKPAVTVLDLTEETTSDLQAVTHYVPTNECRLLAAVGAFTEETDRILSAFRAQLNFCEEPAAFDAAMADCLEKLGVSLTTPQKAHNWLRRCVKGMRKEFDVRIPTRDGRYVLADIYRPILPGKYPVVMSMGAFGKSFINGFTMNEEDEAFFENVEDQFYETYGSIETKRMLQGVFFRRMGPCFASNPPIPNLEGEPIVPAGPPACLVPVSSCFEQAQPDDWVPYGYAVALVEEYGTGKNNDHEMQFGERNAKDYCDAIEWCASREWSSGKVGLFGASYYAMTQYLAAQRHPKGLAAMIPIMGDYDSYRHYIYSGGGLFDRSDNMDLSMPPQEYCFINRAMEQPFWNEETYGPEGEYMSSADIASIDYPIWPVVEPDSSLHGLGSSEAYINCGSKDKRITVINGAGIHFWMYAKEHISAFRAFFDHWLKGEKNDIMDRLPADIQIRTGDGCYYWRHEADWPVPDTEYRRLYLDAADCGMGEMPAEEAQITYSADVPRSETRRTGGVTFVTEPFAEDAEVAGYIKAGLYVSSNTEDMEVHINVRVLDEEDHEVIFPSYTSMERALAPGFGSLKVSHRALNEAMSRDYYPVHAHTKEAYQPLTPDEPVYCEVGTFPTTFLVRRGWKLQLDVDPVSLRWVDYDEAAYRAGSKNTIYTGGQLASFLQIPVLPKR